MKRRNNSVSRCRSVKRKGRGLLNTLINKLPIELHVPGYNYCGPGTKLEKRLLRGDKGVNELDEACKQHDIAYSNFKDIQTRNIADRRLAEVAAQRFKASDAGVGEKIAALGVTGAMKLKSKMGMGLKRKKKVSRKKKGGALNLLAKRPTKKTKEQRIIQAPKIGGFLPFLLRLLGALGAVGGGAAGIAQAVNDAKADRERLAEEQRHNREMEKAATGKGLYLRPYKGYGMYLKPYAKNSR